MMHELAKGLTWLSGMYLDYEGPVSGNRGRVVRWDHGTFSWQTTKKDHLAVVLDGVRLRGTAVLRRSCESAWVWTFTV